MGNSKKWRPEQTISCTLPLAGGQSITLQASREAETPDIVTFSWSDETKTFGEILELCGQLPIPPYLNRETESSDLTDYQTVYARIEAVSYTHLDVYKRQGVVTLVAVSDTDYTLRANGKTTATVEGLVIEGNGIDNIVLDRKTGMIKNTFGTVALKGSGNVQGTQAELSSNTITSIRLL